MLCFSEINYSLVDSFQHIYVCVDASTHTKNYLLVGGVAEHGWVSERRDTFRSQSSVRKKKKKKKKKTCFRGMKMKKVFRESS